MSGKGTGHASGTKQGVHESGLGPVGDLVEVDSRRYKVVPDRRGGVTFEPSATSVTTERRSAAIVGTSGMLAYLAPGVSLADELVADRRGRGADRRGRAPPPWPKLRLLRRWA